MNKLSVAILAFFCGVALTAGLCTFIWLQLFPSETEIWTASNNLTLDGNITIPSGIELVHDTWMPEGFATLRLYVNVEGDALDRFDRRKEPKRQLKIPYWVTQ